MAPVRHRVGRVLSFFSSRGIWDSPTSLAAGECAPPPFGPGGGHTRLRLKGWGSPNSDEGTSTMVLYMYKYFVQLGIKSVYCTWRKSTSSLDKKKSVYYTWRKSTSSSDQTSAYCTVHEENKSLVF